MEYFADGIIVEGVALIPLISIIISMLKGWFKLKKQWVPVVNVALGAVAVFVYAVIEGDVSAAQAITTTITVVFGSSVFHDTFGNAATAIRDALGK